jgi:hypothetical protein
MRGRAPRIDVCFLNLTQVYAMYRIGFSLILLVGIVGAIGCGGPKLVKVTGRVTLDGKDLEDGEITFVSKDPAIGPDAGKITGGRFDVMVKPGSKKVEIRASKQIGVIKDKAMGGDFPQFESIIPDKYNEKSELTLDVPDAGVQDKLFELKSEKRGPVRPPIGP